MEKLTKQLLIKGGAIAGLIAVFASIGSLGPVFNWDNPSWRQIGVNPEAMRANLDNFPKEHCPESYFSLCSKLSHGVKNFLGL